MLAGRPLERRAGRRKPGDSPRHRRSMSHAAPSPRCEPAPGLLAAQLTAGKRPSAPAARLTPEAGPARLNDRRSIEGLTTWPHPALNDSAGQNEMERYSALPAETLGEAARPAQVGRKGFSS